MLVHWFLRCQCSIFAIYCLTMSNLPWFMDLPFQVPMRYCSSQHQTLLSPPDTSTAECHFHFGTTTSFFVELLVIALSLLFPSNILDTSDLRHLSSSTVSFPLFILFMGFFRQESWSELPFPSPVHHVLSELFTMTSLSWVALHSMAHSFKLHKPLCPSKAVTHEEVLAMRKI